MTRLALIAALALALQGDTPHAWYEYRDGWRVRVTGATWAVVNGLPLRDGAQVDALPPVVYLHPGEDALGVPTEARAPYTLWLPVAGRAR